MNRNPQRVVSFLVVAACLYAAIGFYTPIAPARAQSACVPASGNDWCVEYNFTTGQNGFATDGSGWGGYTSGVGFTDTYQSSYDVDGYRLVTMVRSMSGVKSMVFTYGAAPNILTDYRVVPEHFLYINSGAPINRLARVYDPFPSGSALTIGFTSATPISGTFGLVIYAGYCIACASDPGGDATVYYARVEGVGSPPSDYPVATATFTPTTTQLAPTLSNDPDGAIARICRLTGNTNSTFESTGSNWVRVGSVGQNSPRGLNVIGAGSATLKLRLAQSQQYSIQLSNVSRQISGSYQSGTYEIKLGSSPARTISVSAISGTQNVTLTPQSYSPNSDGYYDLVLTFPSRGGVTDPWLRINFACVLGPSASNSPTGSATFKQCETCNYSPVGDIPIVNAFLGGIAWLGCLLRNLWECVILAVLAGIWQGIAWILGLLSFVGAWLAASGVNLARWLTDAFVAAFNWIIGFARNIGTFLGDLINIAILSLSGIAIMVITVGSFIGKAIGYLFTGMRLVALAIGAVFAAATSPLTTPPPINSSVLSYFNVVWYITDNTVFAGPLWNIVYIIMAALSYIMLLWTIKQGQKLMRIMTEQGGENAKA